MIVVKPPDGQMNKHGQNIVLMGNVLVARNMNGVLEKMSTILWAMVLGVKMTKGIPIAQ